MGRMKAWMRMAAAMAVMAVMASGAAAKGFVYWDPADADAAPPVLSATGLYADLAAGKGMAPEAVPYEVNSPLWSDGSVKKRWVLLKPGTSIGFREMDDYWDYPDGAVFVKEFAFDTLPGNPASRVRWETRLMMLKKEALGSGRPGEKTDVWYGFSYRWRPDQKDADLVPDSGMKAALRIWPKGPGQAPAMKKWAFPARSACAHCHRSDQSGDVHGRSVLGFFTAQLNRPSPLSPGVNQLDDLFARNILVGPRPGSFDKSPRWVGIDEKPPADPGKYAADLDRKARSYIAANCSGCHGERGMEVGATFGVSFNYDYHTGVPAMQLDYRQVSWSYGLDTLAPLAEDPAEERMWGTYLVTPRFPQKSVLLFRQTQRNTAPPEDITAYDPNRNQMPPMGSYEVNTAAMAVLEEWIRLMPARQPVGLAASHGALSLPEPVLHGSLVKLPPALLAGHPAVTLHGMDGREWPLRPHGSGEYALPAGTPRGVYILRVGSRKYTRLLW